MILSKYRNPPYRPPSSRPKLSSPELLLGPDMGGEMEHDRQAHQLMQSNLPTTVVSMSETGGSSPRSKAVERLRNLHLGHDRADSSSEEESPPPKRTKRRLAYVDEITSVGGRPLNQLVSKSGHPRAIRRAAFSPSRSPRLQAVPSPLNDDPGLQSQGCSFRPIDQTFPVRKLRSPCTSGRQHTPPDSPDRDKSRQRQHGSNVSFDEEVMDGAKPAPDSPASLPSSATKNSLDHDRVALTWQDDEITGHLIDETLPDDDGEGINGIGFKPTPAIAYARSQRRRQQVHEWKAREAREARQKRFAKRRGINIDESLGVTRRVRFH
nr:hypothetical protein CFP56_19207 [Quercus suber]